MAIGIQPNLRSGEALCSRRASHRIAKAIDSGLLDGFHNSMVLTPSVRKPRKQTGVAPEHANHGPI